MLLSRHSPPKPTTAHRLRHAPHWRCRWLPRSSRPSPTWRRRCGGAAPRCGRVAEAPPRRTPSSGIFRPTLHPLIEQKITWDDRPSAPKVRARTPLVVGTNRALGPITYLPYPWEGVTDIRYIFGPSVRLPQPPGAFGANPSDRSGSASLRHRTFTSYSASPFVEAADHAITRQAGLGQRAAWTGAPAGKGC